MITFEYVYFILFIPYFLLQYSELMRAGSCLHKRLKGLCLFVWLFGFVWLFFCLSHGTENNTKKIAFSSFDVHE